MSTACRSGRWFISAAAVAATVFVATAPASAARAFGGDPCTALTTTIKSVFGVSTPVSESTATGFNGAKGTSCNWGGISAFLQEKASKKGYETSIPKSAKPARDKCSKSVAETGTNTTVTTDAKTGKSKMKTTETQNLWCYRAKPPEELKVTAPFDASALADAEKVANAWMQLK